MATYEPHDKFYRKARERGLPSRAAFKIEEIIARNRLVVAGSGARIVDLGCAPGGWLAILVVAAGADGRVVGVDLAQVKNPPAGAIAIVGDILDDAVTARVQHELGGRADLVTSDLAPKLTGIAARDEARSRELIDSALSFAVDDTQAGRRDGGEAVHGRGVQGHRRFIQAAFWQGRSDAHQGEPSGIVGAVYHRARVPRLTRAWQQADDARKV